MIRLFVQAHSMTHDRARLTVFAVAVITCFSAGRCDDVKDPVDCKTAAEGTECKPLGNVNNPEARRICLASACVESTCGDGFIDAPKGESCEDGNGVENDGCEPDTCVYSCAKDDDCQVSTQCAGARSCDLSTHRCRIDGPSKEGDACQLSAGAMGSCKPDPSVVNITSDEHPALICAFTGCVLDGKKTAGEECDDGNAIYGDGCDDCTFSCNSPIHAERLCDPPTCLDTSGSNSGTGATIIGSGTITPVPTSSEQYFACVDTGNGGKICEQHERNCADYTYNNCTTAQCIPGMGCAYVPQFKTAGGPQGGTQNVPLLNDDGTPSPSLSRWISIKPRTCDAMCDPRYQPLLPISAEQASPTTPFCQKSGDVDNPTCFDSFDYDCNGKFEYVLATCSSDPKTSYARSNGWFGVNDADCGIDSDYREFTAGVASCEYPPATRPLACR